MTQRLKKFTTALGLSTILGLTACGGPKETLSQESIVQTRIGTLQGVSTETDGLYNFKGIPYAQAPIGDFRWRAPLSAKQWDGVKKADTFSPICMQPGGTEDGFLDRIVNGHGLNWFKRALIKRVVSARPDAKMSEDCLYLNIRTAHIGASELAPVMVWIHGGAHQFGSGDYSTYQANGLAEKGVVLVTINYRLGVMGYMAHSALSKDDPNVVSGNYGTLDQIEALKWVQNHIGAFGGDPDNVTIFGESAGSWSVTELMASPLAKGLFHKAIGQSGASTYHLGQMEGNPLGWMSGYEAGKSVTDALGLSDPSAQELRALSANEVQSVVTEKMADGFHQNRDGYVFPENVGHSFKNGSFHAVPTLFGYNADEATLFFPNDPQPSVWIDDFPRNGKQAQLEALREHYPTKADTLMQLYDLENDFEKAGTQFMGDEIFGVNVRYVTRQNEAKGQPAYIYSFGRIPPSKNQTLDAFHAAEIPFVFNSGEGILGISESDKKLTEMMTSYWTNFAKSGNPNGSGLLDWPLYQGQNWMQFGGNNDLSSGSIKHYRKAKLDALEEGLLKKLNDLGKAVKVPEKSAPLIIQAPN